MAGNGGRRRSAQGAWGRAVEVINASPGIISTEMEFFCRVSFDPMFWENGPHASSGIDWRPGAACDDSLLPRTGQRSGRRDAADSRGNETCAGLRDERRSNRVGWVLRRLD